MGLLSDVYSKVKEVAVAAEHVAIALVSPVAAMYIQHVESSENPSDRTLDQFRLPLDGEAWFQNLSKVQSVPTGCNMRLMQVHTIPGKELTGEMWQKLTVPGLEELLANPTTNVDCCSEEGHMLTGEMIIDPMAEFRKDFQRLLLEHPTALPDCFTMKKTVPAGLRNLLKQSQQ